MRLVFTRSAARFERGFAAPLDVGTASRRRP
jgi:hypothetical protein